MAKKQTQKKQTGKRDRRKVAAGVLALTLAALLLLPMVTMIVGGAGAVTQSEIDSLKEEQADVYKRQASSPCPRALRCACPATTWTWTWS